MPKPSSPALKSVHEKFLTVINNNTFYFFNSDFENTYESYINSIREALSFLKATLETTADVEEQKKIFVEFLARKKIGLRALLALTGFSNESLKRLITLIRVVDDTELSELSKKSEWQGTPENLEAIAEWSDAEIEKKLQQSKPFREGVVNIFFEGSSVQFLVKTMKPFELRKLSFSKMRFDIEAMIDTLARYKEKGSYSGSKENNAETYIKRLLKEKNIPWQKGDLRELVTNAPNTKRTMDFIIPNKENPQVIIECTYLMTTSSSQGDKAKTEIAVGDLLRTHYPGASFIGFVDGIGWYVRQKDLARMVSAYEDVFTFHSEELKRFGKYLDERVVTQLRQDA